MEKKAFIGIDGYIYTNAINIKGVLVFKANGGYYRFKPYNKKRATYIPSVSADGI